MSLELTVAERAAVLRVLRAHINQLHNERDFYARQASLGSEVGRVTHTVVESEVAVLDSAVKKLWCERPP